MQLLSLDGATFASYCLAYQRVRLMKANIKFFKKDNVQLTLMSIGTIVFICGFIIAFVFLAFPKDPVQEERAKERAKYFKLKEMEERNED